MNTVIHSRHIILLDYHEPGWRKHWEVVGELLMELSSNTNVCKRLEQLQLAMWD